MAATSAAAIAMAGFILAAAASNPVTEFGENLWTLVIALDVINTVVVVFFLWHIWTSKELPVQRRARNQGS